MTPTRIEVTGDPRRPDVRLAAGALVPRRLRDGVDGSDGVERVERVVRVGLVAGGALLLRGDDVRVEVLVDGPHRVSVREIGGTVAHDMRGGRARWGVDLTLRRGARLAWHAEPFVVARGADVDRDLAGRLDDGCGLALREVLVLGRTGEAGGALRARTRLACGGEPVLAEDLDLADPPWAVLGGRRCLDVVTTVGHRLAPAPEVLQAEAPASVARWLGDELHRSPLGATWQEAVAGVAPVGAPVGAPVPAPAGAPVAAGVPVAG